jgi:uncharacterized protein (DUF2252 family)
MLSSYLGERMLPWRFLNSTVVLRELLPQDLKREMDQLTRDEAISAAHYLASVWQTVLSRNRSKTVDAPSWLWSSVVELVAHHESAYLEHCRSYALEVVLRRRS